MQVLMTLENVPWLQQFLKTAAPEVLKAVGIENRNTAFAMRARARANLRASGHVDTGDLLEAITVDGNGLRWRVGLDDRRGYRSGVRRGADIAHQYPWVRGIWYEKGFLTKHIPTTPYMAPAFESEEPGYQARQETIVNATLAKL